MKGTNRLQIKGMVCNRCISILFDELSLMGLEIKSIQLGEVIFKGRLPQSFDTNQIENLLHKYGFELLNDKKGQLVDRIKKEVQSGIASQMENGDTFRFSDYLSSRLLKEYNYLSAVFSEYEGSTLEKYIITQRIQKVKEQLIHTDKSLTAISDELGYSSVSHLSRQLKSYTGFDTYHFKNLRKNNSITV